MKFYKTLLLFACLSFFINCKNGIEKPLLKKQKISHQLHTVLKNIDSIVIDGIGNEKTWYNSSWLPINQLWLGKPIDSTDFSGRYKLSWSDDALYVLAEIKDDILMDNIKNPLERWWDDDCVEIFIDEDNSGGNHQFNHNAFAYHIGLNGDVVDLDSINSPRLFNNHIVSKKTMTKKDTYVWEFKISLYPDTYSFNGDQTALKLKTKKKVGFAIAYCDNDRSKFRENFIGSVLVKGDNKNQGWINADIFGTILLKNK